MTQNIITPGGASDSLVFTGGNDGTLLIQTGPSGAKVNALAFGSDGTPTFLKAPIVPVQSMVRLHTSNGYGSTNTMIRRFTTQVTNLGSDITYADSATLGATFTINTNGVYAISYSDQGSAANYCGISLNSSELTTSINTIIAADRLVMTTFPAGSQTGNTSWTGYLAAGAVVRPHTAAAAVGSFPATTAFTIVRVA